MESARAGGLELRAREGGREKMAEGQADENPKEQSAVMQFETKQLVVRKM